jgi:hypothetical protein
MRKSSTLVLNEGFFIFSFVNFEYMILSAWNQLTSTIPTEIGELTTLTRLSFGT